MTYFACRCSDAPGLSAYDMPCVPVQDSHDIQQRCVQIGAQQPADVTKAAYIRGNPFHRPHTQVDNLRKVTQQVQPDRKDQSPRLHIQTAWNFESPCTRQVCQIVPIYCHLRACLHRQLFAQTHCTLDLQDLSS